jgi:TPR repeat protein
MIAVLPLVHALDLSAELYSQAMDILRPLPQFDYTKSMNHADESTTVLNIPMDYDEDYELMMNEAKKNNLSDDKKRAYELLHESAQLKNVDALYTLGDIHLYGNWSYPTNYTSCLSHYHDLVQLTPNATVYYNLGFIYATGLFGHIEQDQARANLYYMASHQLGNLRATMVLGYRNLMGIGMPIDQSQSVYYYQIVAKEMKKVYDQAPLGGPLMDSYDFRLSDWGNGIYGKDVGDTSSSLTRKANRYDHILDNNSLKEVITEVDYDYYRSILAYEGTYLTPRDFKKAYYYARKGMEESLPLVSLMSQSEKIYTARCIYLLGLLYMRGEYVQLNHAKAIELFEKSLEVHKLPHALEKLGILYETKDEVKAKEYYAKAVNSSLTYGMGQYLVKHGEEKKGLKLIENALMQGSVPAFYDHAELADPESHGVMIRDLKYFTEFFDPILTNLQWAFVELINDRPENALIGYAMAAEQGFECAQSSTGYLLYSIPSMTQPPPITTKQRRLMAMTYYTRSNTQYNVDSTVLLGDLYYAEEDYDRAVACYETASGRGSAQAFFNLGYMHEMGLGVDHDYHLAKRYYDIALSTHSKAYLPVQLALLRLRFKSIAHNIWGEREHAAQQENKKTWKDWKELYVKIRGEDDEKTQNQLLEEPEEEWTEYEDLFILVFFGVSFAIFCLIYWYQQRQLRQRIRNGQQPPAPQQQPQIQVQFGFIAI